MIFLLCVLDMSLNGNRSSAIKGQCNKMIVCGNKVCRTKLKTGPQKSEEGLKEDEVGRERIGKNNEKEWLGED
jgi:hypothetical protein